MHLLVLFPLMASVLLSQKCEGFKDFPTPFGALKNILFLCLLLLVYGSPLHLLNGLGLYHNIPSARAQKLCA